MDISGEVTEVAGKVDLKCLWRLYLNPAGAVLTGQIALSQRTLACFIRVAHDWT